MPQYTVTVEILTELEKKTLVEHNLRINARSPAYFGPLPARPRYLT